MKFSTHPLKVIFLIFLFFSEVLTVVGQQTQNMIYSPRSYICNYIDKDIKVTIDGELSERAWSRAVWTESFTDIEGDIRAKPYLDTRVKMLWDEEYLYIAAELMESHLWATYDKQDMIIFEENNFEVFIDPDGDTHNYMELELNALGTIWDLLLAKPYRDFGNPINSYDLRSIKKGIKLYGTLNNTADRDDKWAIEIAIPWSAISEINTHKGPPREGEFWKINFSRVEWDRDIKDGKYIKQKDASTKKEKAENNWVWSPQGSIAMHKPEMWGLVIFSKNADEKLLKPALEIDQIKWKLRKIYFQQQAFFSKYGIYTSEIPTDFSKADVEIKVLGDTYTVKYCKNRTCWYLREDSRIWEKKK